LGSARQDAALSGLDLPVRVQGAGDVEAHAPELRVVGLLEVRVAVEARGVMVQAAADPPTEVTDLVPDFEFAPAQGRRARLGRRVADFLANVRAGSWLMNPAHTPRATLAGAWMKTGSLLYNPASRKLVMSDLKPARSLMPEEIFPAKGSGPGSAG